MLRPLTLSLLLATSVLTSAFYPANALAQAGAAPATGQRAPTEALRRYDIAPGPLADVLTQFSTQAGIFLAGTSDLAQGRQSPGVRGSYSIPAALDALLAGTGLMAESNAQGQYRLRPVPAGATTLPPLRIGANTEFAGGPVLGYQALRSATASKTDTPLVEVPQSISVVGRDQMEFQGAQSVQQAVRYSAGVAPAFGDSDSRTDVLQARGYYLRDYLDGSRVPFGAYSVTLPRVEPYGLERIEVLKGPASVLYGQNTPGGMLNMVTKRPTPEPVRELQLQTGNYDRLQGAADFAGALPGSGNLLYRLTGLVRDAKGRTDFAHDEHAYLAPALTWLASDATSITLLSHFQHDEVISDYVALPARGTLRPNPNGELPRNRYPGEPDFDAFNREQYSLNYLLEHRFNAALSFSQSLKYTDVSVDTRATPGYMLLPDDATIMRVASLGEGESNTLGFDNRLQWDLALGGIQHGLLLGYDYLRLEDRYDFASNLIHDLNLYGPVYGAAPIPALIPRFSHVQDMDQQGLYAQDQIRLDRWILTLGARYDRVDSTINSRMAGTTTEQNDDKLTYRLGLNYRFDNGVVPFLSYSTSFEATTGASYAGAAFKPGTGDQWEAGVKFLSPDERYSLSAAVFSTVQQNVTTPDPDPSHVGFSVQTGEVETRGVDVEAKLLVNESLSLVLAYAYNDTEVTKANPDGTGASLLGNPLPRTPRSQASLWSDYRVRSGALAGFGVGGGVRYIGPSFGDNAATLAIPSYAIVDAMLRYDLGQLDNGLNGLDFSLNLANLLDKNYVGYCGSETQCFFGQSRTLYATLQYRW
ncbi:MAG TPA: TonB-dependent siderophore receptor [Hyphomicrobiales bacterium]|nr:TonB-dependent siderophore receptor [Hyphomicrobiales bacterium]